MPYQDFIGNLGFYLCEHCASMVSYHVYHDCEQGKAVALARMRRLLDEENIADMLKGLVRKVQGE